MSPYAAMLVRGRSSSVEAVLWQPECVFFEMRECCIVCAGVVAVQCMCG